MMICFVTSTFSSCKLIFIHVLKEDLTTRMVRCEEKKI